MEKILIIDDANFFLNVLKNMLSKEYDVVTLNDGLYAAQFAKEVQPRLILLDIIMPKISGFDIIKQLKNCPKTANIPVIFLTGLSDEKDEHLGLELGATDYIIKPFRESIVLARVKSHVNAAIKQEQLELTLNELKQEQAFNTLLLDITDEIIYRHSLVQNSINFYGSFSKYFTINSFIKDIDKSTELREIIAEKSQVDFSRLISKARQGLSSKNFELEVKTITGEFRWFNVINAVLFDSNKSPLYSVGKLTDITAQREKIEHLTKIAETDPLTKLLNKSQTTKRIEEMLQNLQDEKFSAFIIIDVDNFKGVNDTLGHSFGDKVLIDIAQKLHSLFRESDVVGRIGGDEFVVFMHNVKEKSAILHKADEICTAFRSTYTGNDSTYKISGSIGIAFAGNNGETFTQLYKNADAALYQSKRKGKDVFTEYVDLNE